MATQKAKIALLAGSLGLAVVYDYLFSEVGLGINFFLFTVIFIGVTLLYHLLFTKEKGNYWALLFMVPGFWYAASVAVYQNQFVGVVAPLATKVMVVLFLFWFGVIEIPLHKVRNIFPRSLLLFIGRWISHMGYPFKWLFRKGKTQEDRSNHLVVALIIVIPLLFLFGALFMSADLMFREWIINAFNFDVDEMTVWRVVRTVALFFFFSGVLYVYTFKKRLKYLEEVTESDQLGAVNKDHGIIESIILGLLNGLFFIFIVAQVIFLFGGHEIIKKYNISYADYVHQGFYQMMVIAGLVLLISYVMHRMNRAKSLTTAKILNVIFIGQTLIIVVSALKRLFLYQQAYGLTQLRFLVWHFIIYTGLVLAILAIVILTKKHYSVFVKVGFIVSVVYLMYLTGINMQAKIARVNVERFIAGQDEGVDFGYLDKMTVDIDEEIVPLRGASIDKTYSVRVGEVFDPIGEFSNTTQRYDYQTLGSWLKSWQEIHEKTIREKSWKEMSIMEWQFLTSEGAH